MLNLVHVRSFIAVAEELHYGRAARRLNLTQSPLSRQIHLLELDLGADLFTRANRRVRLTEAGHAFLKEAVPLLASADAAEQAVRRAARGHVGTVTVGFLAACSYGFLPRLVARTQRELPDVTLNFYELRTPQQVEAVAQGRLDLGLIRPTAVPRGLQTVAVYREGLVLALPIDHPLARRRRPKLSQIDGEPFIMYSAEGQHVRDILQAAFAAADIEPFVVQRLSTAQAILSLVSAGLGLAIVPEETRNACFDNVVFRPIDLGAGQAAELHVVWQTKQADDVISVVRAQITQVGAPSLPEP